MITFKTYMRTIASKLRYKKAHGSPHVSEFDYLGEATCTIQEYVSMLRYRPGIDSVSESILFGEDHYDMVFCSPDFAALKKAIEEKFPS
jgi:hypothetical protein